MARLLTTPVGGLRRPPSTPLKSLHAPPDLSTYVAIAVCLTIVMLARQLMFANFAVTAATTIHDDALQRILYVPMTFFDTNPTGRIINRFASDQDDLDSRLPQANNQFLMTVRKSSRHLQCGR